MAKVKIQGHASGTGVVTVTAPNTSTDRTITLPDGDVTLGAAVGGASGADFNDDVKARFGTGNDLEIYHDGSYSRIKDVGTGSLVISGNEINFNDASNVTNLLSIKDDGRGLSQFTAKAWAAVDGITSTAVFYDSHNCSSITDVGTGEYQIFFTNNMSHADNYVAVATQLRTTTDHEGDVVTQAPLVGSIYISSFNNSSSSSRVDSRFDLLVFGDQ